MTDARAAAVLDTRPAVPRVREIPYEQIVQYQHWYDSERLPLLHRHFDHLRDFAHDSRHFYAAYIGDQIAGFSALSLHQRARDGRAAVYQRSSYTRPRFRRRGVWKSLWAHKVAEIRRRCWAQSDTLIWVLTRPSDLRYARRGFELESETLREFAGKTEPFSVWNILWGDLLNHPVTTRDLGQDVSVHSEQPLSIRL